MKKLRVALLGAAFFVAFGTSQVTTAQADTSQDSQTTTQTDSDVPESVQKAVDDLFDNYITSDTVDVTDASYSEPTMDAVKYGHSFSEFSKIPLVKKFLMRSGFSDTSQLNNVEFWLGDHRIGLGDMDPTYWVYVSAKYNGKSIKSKKINIKYPTDWDKPGSYIGPIGLVGQVTATHEEGKQYAPLLDLNNKKSSRSLAPGSDWYTDQYLIDKNSNALYYRVSTSEWINEYYIKPHANTDFKIADPITSNNSTYTVQYRRNSGEPVYKSDGELWDYTLPNNTDWKITSVAFDQYGVAYYEVSKMLGSELVVPRCFIV